MDKGQQMSIEIGSKWVKDGVMVEVLNCRKNHGGIYQDMIPCVWFIFDGDTHVLTERDFLEQYKPYEEYVYRWVYVVHDTIGFSSEKMTREEFEKHYLGGKITLCACISETK